MGSRFPLHGQQRLLEGNGIPARFGIQKPRQLAIEADRTSITHRRRRQPDHRTAQHAASHGRAPFAAREKKIDERPWQQTAKRVDKRSTRGNVYQLDNLAWSYSGAHDAVLGERVSAPGEPAIR
jgi:hypothetical protein